MRFKIKKKTSAQNEVQVPKMGLQRQFYQYSFCTFLVLGIQQ